MSHLERSEVEALGLALDELEALHDLWLGPGEPGIRLCLCAAAARWRRASVLVIGLRRELGMRIGLLDEATEIMVQARSGR